MTIQCPSCLKKLKGPKCDLNKSILCPNCERRFVLCKEHLVGVTPKNHDHSGNVERDDYSLANAGLDLDPSRDRPMIHKDQTYSGMNSGSRGTKPKKLAKSKPSKEKKTKRPYPKPPASEPDDGFLNSLNSDELNLASDGVKSSTENHSNSIGMTFSLIPKGSFNMGSHPTEKDGEENETPQHLVTLTKPFLLGTHLVTQEQYTKMTGESPFWANTDYLRVPSVKKYPAEYVNWIQALEFCNELSRREGFQPYYEFDDIVYTTGSSGYRLATEAEWEHACRAGSTSPYFWGDDPSQRSRFTITTHVDPITKKAPTTRLQPVGLKEPNAFGLYDMVGNVNEWCWDGYDTYPASPQTDPTGPEEFLRFRVQRGAKAADFLDSTARSAYRLSQRFPIRRADCGFRVARFL